MLTRRENLVLALMPYFSAKEIADRIHRSPDTVRKIIANIKIKTGLQKATELVAFFFCSHFKNEILNNEPIIN